MHGALALVIGSVLNQIAATNATHNRPRIMQRPGAYAALSRDVSSSVLLQARKVA
jgi:hypothetical protein